MRSTENARRTESLHIAGMEKTGGRFLAVFGRLLRFRSMKKKQTL